MTELIRRVYSIRADSIDEKARSIRVIASTDAVDSYSEVVRQDWSLERYADNPVVLYGHNRAAGWGDLSQEETLPIGFATDVGVVDGKLQATLNFVDERATPLAERVWQGLSQGSLRAVSVGFWPHTVTEERVNDVERIVLSNNELFEISVVPIPANPQAVALSASAERQSERAALVARAKGKERDNMADDSELREELGRLKAQAASATAEVTTLKAANADLESRLKKTSEELGATKAELETAHERADKAEKSAIEAEVSALVGVKITAAEKDDFIELRTESPTLFKSMIEKRADLNLLGDESSLTQEKDPGKTVTSKTAGPSALLKNAGAAAQRAAERVAS